MSNAGYRIDEQTLLAEYRKSPHKVRAFLQAAGETVSPDMLVMAWRLLQGAEVAEVELQYQLQKRFGLRVCRPYATTRTQHRHNHHPG